MDRQKELASLKPLLENVDFVRFVVSDLHGMSRCKMVPAKNAMQYLENGIGVAAVNCLSPDSVVLETIVKMEEMKELCTVPNMLVKPDLSTYRIVEWGSTEKYRVAEVLGGLSYNNIPLFNDPRELAKKQLTRLENQGLSIKTGVEIEFVLLNENLVPVHPDTPFLSTMKMTEFVDFFGDLSKGLSTAGIAIGPCEIEIGPGQLEIIYNPVYGLDGPDTTFRVKQAIKETAARAGMSANFMAKLDKDEAGSGAHFNHSIWDATGSKNMLFDGSDPDNLSQLAKHWLAGITKNMPALTALLCPTVNCYRRMHGPWAPSLANWGIDDRLSTVRVQNRTSSATYLENRLPSGLSNPYLVLAATIAAGLDGVVNQLTPPSPRTEATETTKLPSTLEESLQALESNDAMRSALGEDFVKYFCKIKRDGEIDPLAKRALSDEIAAQEEMKMYGKYC